jgi:ribosomal protein S18 acetylase RimI-like enzyme
VVTLVPAGREQRELLHGLVRDYIFEFDGSTDYPYLDLYWEEDGRLPFLIDDAGETRGFCLIRIRGGGWEIAEFSVVAAARRGGVGRAAVDELAARARDDGAAYLQAKVHPDNLEALPFWLACGFREIDSPGVVTTRRAL